MHNIGCVSETESKFALPLGSYYIYTIYRIMSGLKNIILITAVFTIITAFGNGHSVKARITGLESDSLYMSLLTEESALKNREDSLVSAVEQKRSVFSIDTTNRAQKAQEIVSLENQLFSVRSDLGIIVSRTNIIEQEFLMNNVRSNEPSNGEISGSLADFYRKNISESDYKNLLKNKKIEEECELLAQDFLKNYQTMFVISAVYDSTKTQFEADSIMNIYKNYEARNNELVNAMIEKWEASFEENSYILSLLLDKQNKLAELNRINETYKAEKIPADEMEETMSVVFAEYPAQKKLLLGYNILLAESLGLKSTVDSLEEVRKKIIPAQYAVDKIDLRPKEFVKYAGINIENPSPYNTSNPIPNIEIPKKGKLYSITVGTFSNKAAVSTFRNTAPVYVEKLRQGGFRYYIGLYRTFGAAFEDTQKAKDEIGFRRPEVVVWENGVYKNLTTEASKYNGSFRVEIDGLQGKIPPAVQNEIERFAAKKDITRIDDKYFVGTFSNRLHALELTDALNLMEGVSAVIIDLNRGTN